MRHVGFGDGPGHDGLFEKATEDETTAGRGTAVEAEGELLQVGMQMLGCDGALVGAEDPALQQAGDPMDSRHGDVGRIVGRGQHRLVTCVAVPWQVVVAAPPVSADSRTRGNDGANEGHEVVGGGVGHVAHPDPTEALGVEHLDGDHHHRLGGAATALAATLHTADQGLIDLDITGEPRALGTHHRHAEPLKHGPRYAIPDAKRPFESLRGQPVLGGGQVPCGLEPCG